MTETDKPKALTSIGYFIHKNLNKILGKNKKLSSFYKSQFLSNENISKGNILIIKATKV